MSDRNEENNEAAKIFHKNGPRESIQGICGPIQLWDLDLVSGPDSGTKETLLKWNSVFSMKRRVLNQRIDLDLEKTSARTSNKKPL